MNPEKGILLEEKTHARMPNFIDLKHVGSYCIETAYTEITSGKDPRLGHIGV